MIKDRVIFFKEALSKLKDTGALFPTSRWAAKALVAPLDRPRAARPHRILELGPGTGAVTVHILDHMKRGDELTLCEINPTFMSVAKERIAAHPAASKHQGRIHCFCGPVQEMSEAVVFDTIICALPFLNFDLGMVGEIFAKLRRISHPGTIMSYYEHIGMRGMSLAVASPARRARMRQLDNFFDRMLHEHRMEKTKVWANMFPISVYQLAGIDHLTLPQPYLDMLGEPIEALQAANE